MKSSENKDDNLQDIPPTCLFLLAASVTMSPALLFLGSKIVNAPTTLLTAVLTWLKTDRFFRWRLFSSCWRLEACFVGSVQGIWREDAFFIFRAMADWVVALDQSLELLSG